MLPEWTYTPEARRQLAETRRLAATSMDEETTHEFDALNTLLLVVILGLCVLASYMIKKYKCYYIPESAATLLIGLAVGGAARVIDPSKAELDFLSFNPELFFFLLLPPIIFEAGYTLRRKSFFRNLGSIVAFAVVGTLVSTFMIGYLVLAAGRAGWITVDTQDPMEALLFGALISAVDPVATLSIMGNPELHCDPLLYSLVFGESVLNDAVAIVLFRVFYRYYGNPDGITTNQVPAAMLEFTVVSVGSVLVGVGIALICSFVFKNTNLRRYPTYEIGLLFLFAYCAYALAEAIELSGIMALFFAGVTLAHYNSYNLSEVAAEAAEIFFHAVALVSETFVFLYMGMGLFTGRFSGWSPTFIILAIGFCLLARVFNTFPISFVANFTRNEKISVEMQCMIWFAGLRGAIAFALSQNMPGPHKGVYETTTLGIVFFTTLVCGGLTEKVLARTGMKRGVELAPGKGPTSGGLATVATASSSLPDSPSQSSSSSSSSSAVESPSASLPLQKMKKAPKRGCHQWWVRVDSYFMKPLFGGRARDSSDHDDDDDNDNKAIEHVPLYPLSTDALLGEGNVSDH